MKPQKVALHIHEANKLVYAGVYNAATAETSASMSTNYTRARYLHINLYKEDGADLRALKSGFMISIINTDFDGWETIMLDGEHDLDEAIEIKKDQIKAYIELGYTFVGARKGYRKGEKLEFGVPNNWRTKWNVVNMKKEKIDEKINFITQSMINIEVPHRLYSDAYFCIINVEHMETIHNFNTFVIDDLVSLYKYVRLYMSLDGE